MNSERKYLIIISITGIILLSVLIWPQWKSAKGVIKPKELAANEENLQPTETISYERFIKTVFKDTRPSKEIAGILNMPPTKWSLKQCDTLKKWAQEANIFPVSVLAYSQAEKIQNSNGNLENLCLDLAGAAKTIKENQGEKAVFGWFFQESKLLFDKILEKNPGAISARLAKIQYLAEYEQSQPMAFLALMKETYALDSSNIQTNTLYLQLLAKSGQWNKALQKAQKLVSLQPQNPDWYFAISDIYGNLGDQAKSKEYLELAKLKKKETQ